jgi:DnaJ-class molecular chaperone
LESILKNQEKEISIIKNCTCSRVVMEVVLSKEQKSKECFTCRGTGVVKEIRKTFFGTFSQKYCLP